MQSLDPLSERTRVFYAALSLRTFTVKDLADYTGVNLDTVKTYVHRERQWFDDLGSVPSGRPGNSYKRYRLKESAREELQKASAALIAASDADPEQPRSVSATAEDSRFEGAYAAAVSSLSRARGSTLKTREKWLRRARHQLSDAQDALALNPSSARSLRLAQEEAAYRELDRLPLDESVAIAFEKSPGLAEGWLEQVREALLDWTAPRPSAQGALRQDFSMQALDQAFEARALGTTGTETLDSLITPAARLYALIGGAWEAGRAFFAAEIHRRLTQSAKYGDLRDFCGFASMAAILEIDSTVGILFDTFTERNAGTGAMTAIEKWVILNSIARFARPDENRDSATAAMYSQALLSRSPANLDYAILTPAALRAELIDGARLLHTFAERLYRADQTARIEGAVDERVLVKNMVLALHDREFGPLLTTWPALLKTDYGVNFIRALTDPGYEALILDDQKEKHHDFILRLGSGIPRNERANWPCEIALPTSQNTTEGKILWALIAHRARPAEPALISAPLKSKGLQYLQQFENAA